MWRSATHLTIAQMLDVGSARSDFGLPSEWLTFAFQQFENNVASDQCRSVGRPSGKRGERNYRFDPTVNIFGWPPRR
jgi:hypothetical protein